MPSPLRELYMYDKLYPVEREVGIEIEMEGAGLSIGENRYWNQCLDHSLRGRESMEYVTRGPVEIQKVGTRLKNLKKALAAARLNPSDRCGVHIHLNCQHFTVRQILNFMFLYLMVEEILVAYCGEGREGNLFCLRSCDAEAFIDRMIEAKEKNDLYPLVKRGNDLRYSSINPAAIKKFGSLEFRALRTPDDILDVEEWAKILHRLKHVSENYEEPLSFIEHYSGQGDEKFFRDIFGEFSEVLLKKVPDAYQKLLNGIRITQDIAYAEAVLMEPEEPREEAGGAGPYFIQQPQEYERWGAIPVFNKAPVPEVYQHRNADGVEVMNDEVRYAAIIKKRQEIRDRMEQVVPPPPLPDDF